jgi:hypothetical protein
LQGLRHGLATEATARLRCLIGEHGKMNGSVLESLKFQFHILSALLAVVVFERLCVSPHKTALHRFTTIGRFHKHKSPGLAVPDRWGVAGKLKQRVDQASIDRIAAEPADIAAPQDEVAE